MCHGRHREIWGQTLAEWEGRTSYTLWLKQGWLWGNTDQKKHKWHLKAPQLGERQDQFLEQQRQSYECTPSRGKRAMLQSWAPGKKKTSPTAYTHLFMAPGRYFLEVVTLPGPCLDFPFHNGHEHGVMVATREVGSGIKGQWFQESGSKPFVRGHFTPLVSHNADHKPKGACE